MAYPSNTITHCLTLTENLYKLFGNSVFIPREKIAEKTGISDSHLQTQLSTCVQYELLELKSKEGYKPTEQFIKIYKPRPNEDVRLFKIEILKNPELYSKLIADHNNETHTVDSLSTLFFRDYKVSDNASQLAAKIFIDNARELGLIDNDNYFSVESDSKVEEVEIIDVQKPPATPAEKNEQITYLPPQRGKTQNTFDFPPIPIFVDDEGTVAEVYLPKGFNKAHIRKIIQVLEAQIS